MRSLSTLFALALVVTPALADWRAATDEDPMTDDKIAYMEANAEGLGAFDTVSMTVKCWDGKPESTLVAIGTAERWDPSALYAETVPLRLRVDKLEPIVISARPVNSNGYLLVASYAGDEPNVMVFLGQLQSAKKQIALVFGGSVLRFPARGSTAGMKKLVASCTMVLPPQ